MSRHRRILVSLATALVGLVMVLAPPAGAEDTTRIVDDGWWWRAQTGLLTPLPPPPGVEDGQLLVQSTPDGAQAIAAVSAVVAEGRTNPVLTLEVATDGGGAAAVVLACRAGSAWVGDDAGRWDSRPDVDCADSVTGIPADDGAAWTFPVGPLQSGDRVDVVLVPGRLADSDAYPSFHLAFEAPTAQSIATTADQAPTPASPRPASPSAASPPPAPSTTSLATASNPDVAPTPPPTPAPVGVGAQPASGGEAQGGSDTSPVVPQAVAAVDPTEPRTLARLVGAIVLLAGLAGAAGALRSGALGGASATAEAPVAGGLGRFRSERTADPRPVT